MFIVRLCVIQFTRYIPFAAANFDILAQLFDFVKNFFHFLANFFSLCFFARSSRALAYFSRVYPFCQYLFSFFYTYFFVSTACVLHAAGNPKYCVPFLFPIAFFAHFVQRSSLFSFVQRMQALISCLILLHSLAHQGRLKGQNIVYAQAFLSCQVKHQQYHARHGRP